MIYFNGLDKYILFTVKLAYNKLGYNKLLAINNIFFGLKYTFSTM